QEQGIRGGADGVATQVLESHGRRRVYALDTQTGFQGFAYLLEHREGRARIPERQQLLVALAFQLRVERFEPLPVLALEVGTHALLHTGQQAVLMTERLRLDEKIARHLETAQPGGASYTQQLCTHQGLELRLIRAGSE